MDEFARRIRICRLLESDPEYMEMKAEFDRAERRFSLLTRFMPKRLRSSFWNYPGMSYFLYHRLLSIVSRFMRFPDEYQDQH